MYRTNIEAARADFFSIYSASTFLFLSVILFSFGHTASANTFNYQFKVPGTLHETGSMSESSSPYFWLNSGGKLTIEHGIGKTIENNLPLSDIWNKLYLVANPLDTDKGTHPQNLFRLVTKGKWDDSRAEANFRITKDNLSSSPNRNQSNGLLLMSRYKDSANLYYAGIRVDGTAVIKKKYKGTYYTMAQKTVFPGTWNKSSEPNLLPHEEWISLKSETLTNDDGTVSVRLYMKEEGETTWKKLLEAKDDNQKYGGSAIKGLGYMGIRTDFMNVEFDSFNITDI